VGLLELNLIKLLKPKRPEEVSKFKEPNFCHFHCILGHTHKGCFMVKNIIQKMINDVIIDSILFKSLNEVKRMAASNEATFDHPMVSRVVSNEMLEKIMVTSKPEFVNMAFSGYTPQLKLERSNEGKTILR
jgi:hypothetical protein